MSDLGWGTVIQSLIVAACTWFMRRRAKEDTGTVIRSTAAQSTSQEILDRVKAVEVDLALVKRAALADNGGIDHRSPERK